MLHKGNFLGKIILLLSNILKRKKIIAKCTRYAFYSGKRSKPGISDDETYSNFPQHLPATGFKVMKNNIKSVSISPVLKTNHDNFQHHNLKPGKTGGV
jgi:hypothetical protein